MFSHAMEKSDNFKKTVAEFHNRPLTQKTLKQHCPPLVEEPGFKNVKNKHLGMPPF